MTQPDAKRRRLRNELSFTASLIVLSICTQIRHASDGFGALAGMAAAVAAAVFLRQLTAYFDSSGNRPV